MRYLVGILALFLVFVASPAQAGMRLTLVMVTPEQISQLKGDENALMKTLFAPSKESSLEMDKEWHGIHYLLTGEAWSTRGILAQAVFGGSEFGPDMGYGPVRYISPLQVSEIAVALKHLSIEKFKSRYDPRAMTKAGIYPEIWERERQEGLGWLVSGFEQLTQFYGRAAAQGKGVVLAIL